MAFSVTPLTGPPVQRALKRRLSPQDSPHYLEAPLTPLPIAPSLHQAPTCRTTARVQAADPAQGEGPGQHACGWFESSWDLQQGLAVSELSDRDGTAAAMGFSQPDSSSARLQ